MQLPLRRNGRRDNNPSAERERERDDAVSRFDDGDSGRHRESLNGDLYAARVTPALQLIVRGNRIVRGCDSQARRAA